jgi:hypothetical protein
MDDCRCFGNVVVRPLNSESRLKFGCRVKQKDFSPRRIYLTVLALGGVALALVVVAIWGLIKAVQSLPWTG